MHETVPAEEEDLLKGQESGINSWGSLLSHESCVEGMHIHADALARLYRIIITV